MISINPIMNCMNISHLARNHNRGPLLYRLSLSRTYSGQIDPPRFSGRRFIPKAEPPGENYRAQYVRRKWDREPGFEPTHISEEMGFRNDWESAGPGSRDPQFGGSDEREKPVFRREPFKLQKDILKEFKLKKRIEGPADKKGNIYLHWAVNPWVEKEAKECLERGGIDVNSRNYSGMTPLHLVAQQNLGGAVKILIRYGADVNIKNNQGFTPLHLAVYHKAKAAILELLAAGSDVDTQNNEEETPLCTAIRRNSERVVRILMKAGAVISPPGGTRVPPLHLAARLRRKVLLGILMEAGAKLYLQDSLGRTALHYAAERNEYKATYMLLNGTGALIDAMDNEGYTPLHLALKNDCQNTTAMLVQMGADCSMPSPEGGVMDERLVKISSETPVHFRSIPGVTPEPGEGSGQYYGPTPHKPPRKKSTVEIGIEDWDEKLWEEKEIARMRKRERREYWIGKDEELKEAWQRPFVFEEEDQKDW